MSDDGHPDTMPPEWDTVLEENERLASRLSDHKDAISQRDEIIRAQKDENERLRADKRISIEINAKLSSRIDAALARIWSCNHDPRLYCPWCDVRAALKGEGE